MKISQLIYGMFVMQSNQLKHAYTMQHSLEWDSRQSEHFQFHDVVLPND